MVVASTSSPTLKEKLKLTRSLLAPLVPHFVRSSNSRLRGNFFLLRKSASCRPEINPNVNPALKNFSARRFAPEDKFLEGLPLLIIPMLNSIGDKIIF
jgi:hypothetical protein